MKIDEPQIAMSTEQQTALIHLTVPREDIQKVMGPGYEELMSALKAQGIAPTGPWLTHHLSMDPATFDFEICIPVSKPVAAMGRVRSGRLPATRVARTVYRGPYEGLAEAWSEFQSWIASKGLTPAADLWEVYAAGPETGPDPNTWRTELNRPLVR